MHFGALLVRSPANVVGVDASCCPYLCATGGTNRAARAVHSRLYRPAAARVSASGAGNAPPKAGREGATAGLRS